MDAETGSDVAQALKLVNTVEGAEALEGVQFMKALGVMISAEALGIREAVDVENGSACRRPTT